MKCNGGNSDPLSNLTKLSALDCNHLILLSR